MQAIEPTSKSRMAIDPKDRPAPFTAGLADEAFRSMTATVEKVRFRYRRSDNSSAAIGIYRISRRASGSPKALIGWVLQTISRVAIFNPSVYATCPTFPPDTFCGYRRRLGLSNLGDIC
jgi:hypothetical protein